MMKINKWIFLGVLFVCMAVLPDSSPSFAGNELPDKYRYWSGDVEVLLTGISIVGHTYFTTDRVPSFKFRIETKHREDLMPKVIDQTGRLDKMTCDNEWSPTEDQISEVTDMAKLNKVEHKGTYYVFMNIPMPPRTAQTIKELEGSITVYYREPEKKEVFLEYSEKGHPSVDAGPFRLTWTDIDDESHLRVKLAGERLTDHHVKPINLYEWELVLKNGKSIMKEGMGTSGMKTGKKTDFTPRFPFKGELDQIKGLKISWYEDIKGAGGTTIPFAFRDIPLP
ncbi:hypothetical protein HY522_00645 [bacterium]|nr:hypothetical protein [bacterium]